MANVPRTFNNWLILGIILLLVGGGSYVASWLGLSLIGILVGATLLLTGVYQALITAR